MALGTTAALLLGGLGAAPAVVRAAALASFTTGEDERLWTPPGRDGFRLALHRYRPAPGAPRRRAPVLLVPGLGATRFTWDLGVPRLGLARHLARAGFDTFALELRGHGLSEGISASEGRRGGWDLDAHLHDDVPSAIATVLARTRADGLHWLGHSLGGVIGLAYLASRPDAPVRSVTAVGSSLDYAGSGSDFERVLFLRALAPVLPRLPFGWAAATAPIAGVPLPGGRWSPLDLFHVWPPNVERRIYRRVVAVMWASVEIPVLEQLASAVTGGGLRSADGRTSYFDDLGRVRTPALLVCADRDRQCPPAAAQRTFEALGSADRALVRLGRAHGTQDHYGHMDMIVGRRAPEESWPPLLRFLERVDAG
jgi:pimeloyl-ACP methyl ester carboxylesterase